MSLLQTLILIDLHFFQVLFPRIWAETLLFKNIFAAKSDCDWFQFEQVLFARIWQTPFNEPPTKPCHGLIEIFVINWFQISWLYYKKDIAISKYITFNLSVYPLISSTKRSTSARVRARQWPEVSDFVAHFARCKNTLPCENSKSFLKRKKVALGHCLIRAYMQQHTRKCTFT